MSDAMHRLSEEDRRFVSRFEACQVPAADFNHQAHVRLAYAYLVDNDLENAVTAMRSALVAFLKYNNINASKYHETLTRAWILAVRHFMQKSSPSNSAAEFIGKHPDLLDSKIMLTHYSAEVLFSDEARAAFVEPNVDPIPRYGGRRDS